MPEVVERDVLLFCIMFFLYLVCFCWFVAILCVVGLPIVLWALYVVYWMACDSFFKMCTHAVIQNCLHVMWFGGVILPCVCIVLKYIVRYCNNVYTDAEKWVCSFYMG